MWGNLCDVSIDRIACVCLHASQLCECLCVVSWQERLWKRHAAYQLAHEAAKVVQQKHAAAAARAADNPQAAKSKHRKKDEEVEANGLADDVKHNGECALATWGVMLAQVCVTVQDLIMHASFAQQLLCLQAHTMSTCT